MSRRVRSPKRPADRRPGDKPYYVEEARYSTCKTALVCVDADRGWYDDEFRCPRCRDGLVLDVPESAITQ